MRDVRQDIDQALSKLKKTKAKGQRIGLGKDLKDLRKELREREKSASLSILKNADVVLATLTTSGPDGPLRHLPQGHFDFTVIDECSQVIVYNL